MKKLIAILVCGFAFSTFGCSWSTPSRDDVEDTAKEEAEDQATEKATDALTGEEE